MALTRHEIASQDPVASTPKIPASTENAFASTNSSQFVPRMEVAVAVEANLPTLQGVARIATSCRLASEENQGWETRETGRSGGFGFAKLDLPSKTGGDAVSQPRPHLEYGTAYRQNRPT